MIEKRFTIKPQDDLFGVVDNYSADKVCVINGIRTEIEAEWLCKDMNTLNDENEQLKSKNRGLQSELQIFKEDVTHSNQIINKLNDENEQLKKDCTVLIYHNQEYRKENEQLKADKQALIDFIKKEFPKSHKHILEGFE